MLITFKSRAAAEIVMYKKHIQELLVILDKDVERGVITAAETGDVIKKIEQYVMDMNKQHDQCMIEHDPSEEENFSKQKVSTSARLFPLLEMIKAANKQQKDVLWGV